MKYYLYRHTTEDCSRVFYVGIGTKPNTNFRTFKAEYRRAFHTHNRSKFWNNVRNKHGVQVEIMYETNNRDLILEKEKEFIDLWKDSLTNITLGGEGCIGRVKSEGEIKAISKSRLGGKNPMARQVVNIITGEVFDSIIEAAKFSKYTELTLRDMLSKPKKINYSVFRYIEDREDKLIQKPPVGNKVVCVSSGKVFKTQAEAAEYFGVTPGAVSNHLKGKHTSRKFNVKWL